MEETTAAFKHKYKMGDEKLFSVVTEDLNQIIFKGKTYGWYTHLNTLVNHLEWYYTHSINVAIITALIARKLDYNDKKIEEIILGALFHDIGKIFVPDHLIWYEETEPQKKNKI